MVKMLQKKLLPEVLDNTEGVEENIEDGQNAAKELPGVLNNQFDNTAPLKVQAQVPPDPHDPAAYNHPHAIVDDDEKLIRTELERDKYKREVEDKEHLIKEYEETNIRLQKQLKLAQKSIIVMQKEKDELMKGKEEAEREKDQLAKKLEDMELMGNVEVTEVRKEKEREIAKAMEAVKRENKKKEELQKELNDMEADKIDQLQLQKATVDDLRIKLAQKEEDILLAQAETATERKEKEASQEQLLKEKEEEKERLQKQLEDLKTEHEIKLREQKEKHKFRKKELKSEVERLTKAEKLRQSEVPDIGGTKRETELERELGIEKDHVTSLQERIATMKEGLQEERIKAKDKEKLHKQELERERAQIKVLTDDRANLERKHKQEVASLKEQWNNEVKQLKNELIARQKDNEEMKNELEQKKAETRRLKHSEEEQRTGLEEKEAELKKVQDDNDKMKNELKQKEAETRRLKYSEEEQRTRLEEKEAELKKVQDERNQTVSQLLQRVKNHESTIAQLEEQLGVKNAEIDIYKQDFDNERKDRENAHSKVAVLEVKVMELTAHLAEKETELAEARKESKKLRNKSKELEQGETDRVKEMEDEIQVLTAQVNAYSREVDRQKRLVTQSQEKQKNEVSELNERLANEIQSKQQLDGELARMRQQLANVSANRDELLTAYNKEQAAVTSLEQQLNSTRKELDRAKKESATMKDANTVLSKRLKSVGKDVSHEPKRDHYPYNRHHDIEQSNEGPQSLDSISPHTPSYQQHPQSPNIHISNVHNIPIVSADGGDEGHQYQERDRRRDGPRRLQHNASDSNIQDQPGGAANNYRPRSHSNETERQRVANQRRQEEERRRRQHEEERRRRQHEEMRKGQEEEARRIEEDMRRRYDENIRRQREREAAEEAEWEKARQEADRLLKDLDEFRRQDAHHPPRSPLASSQNIHKRKHQESVATQEREEKPKKKGKQQRKTDDDSDSDIEENKLIDNIDEEIQQMAEDVRKGSRGPTTAEVLFDDGDSSLPYDPNLVCPKCGKQYRVGEIQKLRRHINEFCTGIR
ncbi:PREDICTED: trichohyalin-like [Amphimedon queenslandica]|uniref:Uncharacterized protein n=1 Tax=Amphimedon queenslandica TaxID=400682 RepID=A0AAN0IWL1_AMPQE|nr:PREDICTED: trichohyalin-like [Amphimedon queenslandica]|eukprot:XP_019848821.1 PREDICTED: trichohyalin-like [Amphimedon queenslandica]